MLSFVSSWYDSVSSLAVSLLTDFVGHVEIIKFCNLHCASYQQLLSEIS